MISFDELLLKRRPGDWRVPKTLVALDPGETTGWASFNYGTLEKQGELKIETFPDTRIDGINIWNFLDTWNPDVVVIEGYRIYAQKAAVHTWSALYTPKLIGYIEGICQFRGFPYYIQMASTKQFCSDSKLKSWGYYSEKSRHSRDAVRHGCYWLLFGKE